MPICSNEAATTATITISEIVGSLLTFAFALVADKPLLLSVVIWIVMLSTPLYS